MNTNIEYQKTLSWLDTRSRFGMKLDLENIRELLEALGNPHSKLNVVHVAGTNGKGSTCAMMVSILREAGYSVGLYTSPHLISPRERIQKNGEWISEGHFVKGILEIRCITENLEAKNIFPTYFELITALAFWFFAQKKVDWVVLETGMGGRLDATNIVNSKTQVITNIDLEHTQYLGKTIGEIASEKAGIIKSGSHVVTAAQGEALEVIEARADLLGARVLRLGHELSFEKINADLEAQRFKIHTTRDHYDVCLKLLGSHQMENAVLAVAAVECLREGGALISNEAVLSGLEKACWPGRFEVIQRDPLVILDAAHNPAGAQVLARTWKKYLKNEKALLIFSALKDKDVEGMVQELSNIVREVRLVQVHHERGLSLGELEDAWEKVLPPSQIHASSLEEMLEFIHDDNRKAPLLITGSIYLLGEVLEKMCQRHNVPMCQ
ncbi:MAG: bifunctional folylpolyglutamate synthase/dihydrofolate synthase [Chlamydiae bacterium]|nr:bifunctional folylpolyglutamate synthase/dihydrofolate synthase [Chlamydiota bacterium]MBI3265719.1 bifunctional folylpolyglutamate synthase/dihydrofolate synthase [Chlamydiota bacterium]